MVTLLWYMSYYTFCYLITPYSTIKNIKMQIFTILKKTKFDYFRYISKSNNNQKLLRSGNRDHIKKTKTEITSECRNEQVCALMHPPCGRCKKCLRRSVVVVLKNRTSFLLQRQLRLSWIKCIKVKQKKNFDI